MTNPLRRWIKAFGQGDQGITHTFIDGGKASIPAERIAEFHAMYAGCIQACIPVHLVERTPSDRFRMFFDIDLSPSHDDALAQRLARDVVATVEMLLDGAFAGSIVVCGKRGAHPKRGMHLVWDSVVVDRETAACLRDETLERVTCLPRDELDKVLDASVYRSGLRMLWSHKGISTPATATDYYEPLYVLTKDDDTCCWKRQDVVVAAGEITAWLQRCALRPPTTTTTTTTTTTRTSKDRRKLWRPLLPNGARGSPVERAVEDALPSRYGTPGLRVLVRTDDVCVLSSSSRYCANAGREHRSNHVYFVVTREGVHQRCHCTCATTTDRRYGLCKTVSIRVCDAPPGVLPDRPKPARTTLELVQRQRALLRQQQQQQLSIAPT